MCIQKSLLRDNFKAVFLYNHKNRTDLEKRDLEHYYTFERADENLQ